MKVLNLGSLNMDHVYIVPHFVQAGETLTMLRMDTYLGGKGFNQSAALAKAGAKVYPGTNRAFTKERMDSILAHFGKGDYLVLQNEINLVDYAIDAAYEKGMTIVLNPSPYDAYLDTCDLTKVRYLLLNEVEGEMMTGHREPDAILDSLLARYPRIGIVLTLGEEGAVYRDALASIPRAI